jgi:hypothetical protein
MEGYFVSQLTDRVCYASGLLRASGLPMPLRQERSYTIISSLVTDVAVMNLETVYNVAFGPQLLTQESGQSYR